MAFGPGTYEPLLNIIGEDDDARLVPHLLAACDRHLDEAGLNEQSLLQEFELGFELIPAEICAIKVARQKLGLGFPKLEHPLMSTPLANVPTSASYDYRQDEELKAPLDYSRYVYADLLKKVRPENVKITALPPK